MTWFDFHSSWSWGQNIFNSMLTCGDLSCMRSAVDKQRDFRLAQVWPSQEKATWLESSPQVSKRRSIFKSISQRPSNTYQYLAWKPLIPLLDASIFHSFSIELLDFPAVPEVKKKSTTSPGRQLFGFLICQGSQLLGMGVHLRLDAYGYGGFPPTRAQNGWENGWRNTIQNGWFGGPPIM